VNGASQKQSHHEYLYFNIEKAKNLKDDQKKLMIEEQLE
jgi:hypothetical protein